MLSLCAVVVLSELGDAMTWTERGCWETTLKRETLAQRIGVSGESVKRAVGELRKAGIISSLPMFSRRHDGNVRRGANLYRMAPASQRVTTDPEEQRVTHDPLVGGEQRVTHDPTEAGSPVTRQFLPSVPPTDTYRDADADDAGKDLHTSPSDPTSGDPEGKDTEPSPVPPPPSTVGAPPVPVDPGDPVEVLCAMLPPDMVEQWGGGLRGKLRSHVEARADGIENAARVLTAWWTGSTVSARNCRRAENSSPALALSGKWFGNILHEARSQQTATTTPEPSRHTSNADLAQFLTMDSEPPSEGGVSGHGPRLCRPCGVTFTTRRDSAGVPQCERCAA
jgi:hypothetical protein